jgi:hypothetical protein
VPDPALLHLAGQRQLGRRPGAGVPG